MSTPEGRIKRKLDKMLKDEGVWFFSPQAGPYGKAGIPDRVACIGGRFIGIECKADATKKPTKLQELCGAQIIAAGGFWFLVASDADVAKLRGWVHDCRTREAEASVREPNPLADRSALHSFAALKSIG